MKLVDDAMTEMGQGFAGFFDNLSEEDFGKDVSNFIDNLDNENEEFTKDVNDLINKSSGLLSGFFDKASEFFDSYAGTLEDENEPNDQESGEIPQVTTMMEKIVYYRGADGATSDKTVETTKTYADGHTTHTIENFPGPLLEQDSSFSDIMMGYKDVIEMITPKMLKLSEDNANDLTSAFDKMFNKFEDKTKDMDTEDVLELSDISKEELLQDYENFSSSYGEIENVENITENEDLSKKFDKLADNFSKVMTFA